MLWERRHSTRLAFDLQEADSVDGVAWSVWDTSLGADDIGGNAILLRAKNGWILAADLWRADYRTRARAVGQGFGNTATLSQVTLRRGGRRPIELDLPLPARDSVVSRPQRQGNVVPVRIGLTITRAGCRAGLDEIFQGPALFECQDSDGVRLLAAYLAASLQVTFCNARTLGAVKVEVVAVRSLDLPRPPTRQHEPNHDGTWLRWWRAVDGDRSSSAPHMERWRREIGADAVFLIEDMDGQSGTRSFAGYTPFIASWAEGPRTPKFGRRAYVDARCAVNSYTVAHEFGHLVGCDHAPKLGSVTALNAIAASQTFAGSKALEPFACGWQSPTQQLQTVMADLSEQESFYCDIAPVWSEPGVDWFGEPTDVIGISARGAPHVADEVHFLREYLPRFTGVDA